MSTKYVKEKFDYNNIIWKKKKKTLKDLGMEGGWVIAIMGAHAMSWWCQQTIIIFINHN